MSTTFPYDFIAIEGNIGAGKTTLCQKLADDFNGRLILEQFADNPFLPFFYENPERYAFTVELFFMTERHKQLQEMLPQQELFRQFTVADYFFLKTLLFAKNSLSEEEYRLFTRLFGILNNSFPKPDIIVYLHRSVEKLLANIKKRGRSYEQDISPEYLRRIQDVYFEYFRTDNSIPILIINAEDLDYLHNPEDYDKIVECLSKTYQPGLHQISFTV
ncbi:MAG: deoxynucleoside kinase [Bacteroidota bacterium]